MRPATMPLPKRCIFCGKKAKLTREDFFPNWFRELYPAEPESRSARLNAEVSWHELNPETGKVVIKVAASKLARSGDLADQTLRVVCAPCNNGWMSQLQESAKVALTPYILGKWSRPNRHVRRLMSSWATMFAMVVEFGDEPSAVVPPIEREVFCRDQQPTLGAVVWAGRIAGDLPYWFHQRTLGVTMDPNDRKVPPNAVMTTITLGHLMLQVYLTTSDLKPIDFPERARRLGLTTLWPLNDKSPGHHRAEIRDGEAARTFAYQPLGNEVQLGLALPYTRDQSGLSRGARG